jgi:hypothetical protein
VPYQWCCTLSGFENGSCTDCTNINGTYTFTYLSGCIWSAGTIITECDQAFYLIFGYDSAFSTWNIALAEGGPDFGSYQTLYVIDAADFVCNAPNVLTANEAGTACGAWGTATTTISPC